MNDIPDRERWEAERLQGMLEGVTSDCNRDVWHNESEEAGLRETWLAFGRLLDAAEEVAGVAPVIKARIDGEENAGSPQLQAKVEALSQSMKAHFTDHEWKVRRIRRWVAIAAVAASACLVLMEVGNLTLNRWLVRAGEQIDHGQPVIGQNRPQKVQPQPPVLNEPAPNVPAPTVVHNEMNKRKQKTSTANSTEWDDPIDTQITAVSQQIDSVRQTWQHRVDDADLVQYHIDEVSAGLSKDAL